MIVTLIGTILIGFIQHCYSSSAPLHSLAQSGSNAASTSWNGVNAFVPSNAFSPYQTTEQHSIMPYNPPPPPPGHIPSAVPAGLTQLVNMGTLIIKQNSGHMARLTKSNNEYEIGNENGEKMLDIKEKTSTWSRHLWGKNRFFQMDVIDPQYGTVFTFKATNYIFTQQVQVEIPEVNWAATIDKPFTLISSQSFYIRNSANEIMFRIDSPYVWLESSEATFKIYDSTETTIVGTIKHRSRTWGQVFLDTDIFELKIPQQIDVYRKAALIGAVMHIDFTFYEPAASKSKSSKKKRT